MNISLRVTLFLSLASCVIAVCVGAVRTVAAPANASLSHYHLVKRVPVPGEGGWDYLTFDSQSHRLFVARFTHVSVVDVQTGQVVGDIPDLAGVHGVAIDPQSRRGFTSNGRSNSVTIFDLKTLRKLREVPVGAGPDAIVFDPASRRVFTFNGEGRSATAIDAATGKVVGTVALPGSPEAAVSDRRGHLYNNIADKNEVAVINTQTLKVEHFWPLGEGKEPSGIAMDRKSRRLFSVCDNQKLVVLDADTGQLVATLPIGNGPDGCEFDPGSHSIFSSNGQDGTLSVLREVGPNKYEKVGTIATQQGARTMTLDEKTHTVYTFSGKVAPSRNTPVPDEPRRRPSYIPGSLSVLIYRP